MNFTPSKRFLSYSLLALLTASFSALAHPGPHGLASYKPRFTLGGLLNKHSDQRGAEVEAWVPLYQNPHQVLFADVRGLTRHSGQREANLALGYRLMPVKDALFGLYASFDPVRSGVTHHTFHQLTLGGESWLGCWFLGANAYFPIGKSKQENPLTSLSRAFPADAARSNYYTLQFQNDYEYFTHGFDATVGFEPIKGLVFKAGGFFFRHAGAPHLAGPQVQVRSTLYASDWHTPLDRISATFGYRYDRTRGSVYRLGLRLSLGLGHQRPLSRLAQHMIDHPDRDLDGVFTLVHQPVQTVQNADNTPWIVAQVKTPQEFYNAYNDTTHPVHTIAVNGTLADFDSQQLTPDPSRTLPFNITGSSMPIIFGGQLVTIQLAHQGTLKALTGQPLFSGTLHHTYTFSHITLQVDPGQDVFIHNGPFTATFDHVIADGGLIFILRAASDIGTLTLTHSQFNSTSGHGIELTGTSHGTLNITEITHTTLSGKSTSTGAYGLGNFSVGSIAVGLMSYSTILGEGVDNGFVIRGGIGLLNHAAGSLEFGTISHSTIQGTGLEVPGIASTRAYGLLNDSIGTVTLGPLSDSTIAAVNNAQTTTAYAYGLFNDTGTLTLGNLSSSSIAAMSNSQTANAYAYGLYNAIGTLTLGNLSGSSIAATSNNTQIASASTYGIYNSSGTLTLGDLSSSSITSEVTAQSLTDVIAIDNYATGTIHLGHLNDSKIAATATTQANTYFEGHGIKNKGAFTIDSLSNSLITSEMTAAGRVSSFAIRNLDNGLMSIGNLTYSSIRSTASSSSADPSVSIQSYGILNTSAPSTPILSIGNLEHSTISATAIASGETAHTVGIGIGHYAAGSLLIGDVSTGSSISGTATGTHLFKIGLSIQNRTTDSVITFGDLTGAHFEGTTGSIVNTNATASIQGTNISLATYSPEPTTPELTPDITERTP